MKLMISAGETSGDQRAAEVLTALGKIVSTPVESFGLGGHALEAAGMKVTHQLDKYAVMGFGEILKSLGKFLKLEKELKSICEKQRPDCILLVDYPGFNMRFGRWARKAGIPVIHYIAPQMWAWGSWRIRKLRKSTDLLLTLFAFEEPFFREKGVNAIFTGHPLKKMIPPDKETGNALGLLPGSRLQEVEKLLPLMLNAFTKLRNEGIIDKALVAVSTHLKTDVYEQAKKTSGVKLLEGTGAVLSGSKAALVCSGTATLETALYGVPFLVCYKTSSFTYMLAKRLVKGVKNIGLANIIAGEVVAAELIQDDVTPVNMISLIKPLLLSRQKAESAKEKLLLVRNSLGDGDPAENAAREIVCFLSGSA